MLKNERLHKFLCSRNEILTEQWYESLDKSKKGIYSTTDPKEIEQLKKQNYEFHVLFCSMFSKDHNEFLVEFQDWIKRVAKDEAHLNTPLEEVLEEFFNTQKQYLKLLEEYYTQNIEFVSHEQYAEWNLGVVDAISEIVQEFTVQNTEASQVRLQAQQELIVEMSAPVILLSKNTGLLPLVGEINTYRSQVIFEKALEQSSKYSIDKLYIDLSGVPIIDTMVAQQIFQLIYGLRIIGVRTALSGISPEIAQTAVQLGIQFTGIEVYSTLVQAIDKIEINA
ncbi:STAS domain-containing protein [Planomicrobium sp. CPCC 101079]|uniref:STAS domain-containing protein n=1 Tax=Planomicrobium sp. CPCC 101079 TaxID=2599618 RepID=UPI0011B66739|nr:STAS domain-containing protein [Planomicrobium sp. CPCC 101079]TWT01139.1 STAS domain-containing protein [Planomicrobium sp. CPCC 101079]